MIFLNLFDRLIKKKDVYFKYSTEEQWTGEYWINNKKIYCKVVSWSGLSTGTGDKSHSISNVDFIVDYDIICTSDTNNGFVYKFPSVYYASGGSGTFYDTYFSVGRTYIHYWNSTSWSNYTFYAIIYYTKTTD